MGRRNTEIKKCVYCGEPIQRISSGKPHYVHEPSDIKYCSRNCYMQWRRENIPCKKKDRLFHVWKGMRERCSYKNHTSAEFYQSRGITVCEEWDSDFEVFKRWALDNGYGYSKPRREQTLDRIDNSKGYSPDNCRWVTMVVNNQNTRRNVNLTYKGKTQCISAWSREFGISIGTIRRRVRQGLSTNEIFEMGVNDAIHNR